MMVLCGLVTEMHISELASGVLVEIEKFIYFFLQVHQVLGQQLFVEVSLARRTISVAVGKWKGEIKITDE